jgi:hypothetical protein
VLLREEALRREKNREQEKRRDEGQDFRFGHGSPEITEDGADGDANLIADHRAGFAIPPTLR